MTVPPLLKKRLMMRFRHILNQRVQNMQPVSMILNMTKNSKSKRGTILMGVAMMEHEGWLMGLEDN
jgi:hypothetical protein